MIELVCKILKKNLNELIYKIETDSQTLKTNLQVLKGSRRDG